MERTLAEEIKLYGSMEGLQTLTEKDIADFYKDIVGKYPVVAIYHSIGDWKGNLIYKVGQRYVTIDEPIEYLAEYDITHSASLEQLIEYIQTSIEGDTDETYTMTYIKEVISDIHEEPKAPIVVNIKKAFFGGTNNGK